MKLFLDSSVLLAACGSSNGSSAFIIDNAARAGWRLLASHYVIGEVNANVDRFGPAAVRAWEFIACRVEVIADVFSIPWPTVFTIPKDRPVLFSAAAYADTLLTLDRNDFVHLLGQRFYHLKILMPSNFLIAERAAGRV